MKKILLVLLLLVITTTGGCARYRRNEYDVWRRSEFAEDLNGDSKIDRLDFDIYQYQEAFRDWRNSDDAEDFNGDRKINELDYEIYLSLKDYDNWRKSDKAEDLNGDRKIDKEDFMIYLENLRSEDLAGVYIIKNYEYDGSEFYYLGNFLSFSKVGELLSNVRLTVNHAGRVSANLDQALLHQLGEDYQVVYEGLDNMTMTQLSRFLLSVDTSVTIDGVKVYVTIYLTKINNGYLATYSFFIGEERATISFHLIKD